jgi:hypothetical protein
LQLQGFRTLSILEIWRLDGINEFLRWVLAHVNLDLFLWRSLVLTFRLGLLTLSN